MTRLFPSIVAVLFAAFSLTTAVVRADITTDLVAQYLFDGNANDSIGSANGTPSSVSYFSSVVGGQTRLVADFGGASSVVVPETSSIDLTSAFTLAGWFKISSWVDGGINGGYPLFRAGGIPNLAESAYTAGITAYSLDLTIFGANDYPVNSLYAGQRANSPSASNPIPDTTLGIVLNDWYHLAWTYDGVSIRQYLDGAELVNTVGSATASNINPYSGFGTLLIGAPHGSSSGFVGQMSDLRVYDRALTSSEIAGIPEPSTYALLLMTGAGGLWMTRKRR
jgi:hypothetical protein